MTKATPLDDQLRPTGGRRRHSKEFKEKGIRAALQPHVSIAAVALHYRLNANLLRRWHLRSLSKRRTFLPHSFRCNSMHRLTHRVPPTSRSKSIGAPRRSRCAGQCQRPANVRRGYRTGCDDSHRYHLAGDGAAMSS
ncbi:transposase [Burkholderia sp. MS455]|uniref:transposase n=1 Tax=Burkholderia sp. MS455 TaxID=2811788 RepID=UPI001EF641D0|nr:transposase [Burkholderia sp. MS455]